MSSEVLSGARAEGSNPYEWRRMARDPGSATANDRAAAKQEADQTAALKAEMERRVKQAHDTGRQEGEAAGREKAAAEFAAARENWLRSAESLLRYRPDLRRQAEKDVVKLALAIARRIVHREVCVDPGALIGIVKAATEALEGRELERVRVHPDHVAILRDHFQAAGMAAKVTVVADPSLATGALLLETPQGGLDASVETQLDEIERGLADLLQRR